MFSPLNFVAIAALPDECRALTIQRSPVVPSNSARPAAAGSAAAWQKTAASAAMMAKLERWEEKYATPPSPERLRSAAITKRGSAASSRAESPIVSELGEEKGEDPARLPAESRQVFDGGGGTSALGGRPPRTPRTPGGGMRDEPYQLAPSRPGGVLGGTGGGHGHVSRRQAKREKASKAGPTLCGVAQVVQG